MLGWTQEILNKERLWILAGNYKQFDHYNRVFKEYGFEPIYLSNVRKIRGVRGEKFIRVGTWYDQRSRELEEILAVLSLSDFTEMRHEVIEREEEERRQWYDRQYTSGIKPISFGKGKVTIWGQKNIPLPYPAIPEFLSVEEMTI
jgi:hypothetical protein